MRRNSVYLSLLYLLILTSTIFAIGGQLASAEDPIVAKMDERLARFIADKKCVGIAAGVIKDGVKTVKGYGVVSPGEAAVPTGDTVYEIGSITKVFTAIVLADMTLKNEVKLEYPVASFLPQGTVFPSKGDQPITLLHLTVQNSGLPRMPFNIKPTDPENPYADYTPALLYECLAKRRLSNPPGEKYLYSNLGVGLLGHALSLRAGMSYESLVDARILKPLGLKDTAISFTPEMKTRLAPPYAEYGKPAKNWDMDALAGAGALRSTVNDMLKFAVANFAASDDAIYRAMAMTREERFKISSDMSIGMGWHMLHFKERDEPIVWHNGGTGGYHAFLGLLMQKKAAVVVLTNTNQDIDGAAIEILKGL